MRDERGVVVVIGPSIKRRPWLGSLPHFPPVTGLGRPARLLRYHRPSPRRQRGSDIHFSNSCALVFGAAPIPTAYRAKDMILGMEWLTMRIGEGHSLSVAMIVIVTSKMAVGIKNSEYDQLLSTGPQWTTIT